MPDVLNVAGEARQVRLKLIIAYDGRPFCGWQSQATADSVQDHLEKAFTRIAGEKIAVHGSGRTDAGVHALGQTAHVDVPPGKLAPAKWQAAANANLPHEIRVLRATRAPAGFHARFDSRGKVYTYRIWNGPFLHPLEIGRAWFVPAKLDFDALRQTATLLEGRHDFAGFAANRGTPSTDTIRTLHRIEAVRSGARIVLRFHGEGFLYKMVRLLTGSLIRCAQHRADGAWIQSLLLSQGKTKTHFEAPAEGLYLTKVLY